MTTTPLVLDPKDGILVYTDGSATVKDNRAGGWAYVALDSEDGLYEDAGGEVETTISRMELMGPIQALTYLSELNVSSILLISDSQYVVRGFMDPSRARNKNNDLWDQLDSIAGLFPYVKFEHTPGHAGNHWNEIVDKAAVAARKAVHIKDKE